LNNVNIKNDDYNRLLVQDDIENKKKIITEGSIEFQNVKFNYPCKKDQMVFKNLSFKIPAGSTVAVVGYSGAGKSTIASLIQRFYDVDDGVILIDGTNIKEFDPYTLHKQIGFVQQEPVLFSGTIKENVLFSLEFKDEKTIEKIINYKINE